jgi:hypothetical protein
MYFFFFNLKIHIKLVKNLIILTFIDIINLIQLEIYKTINKIKYRKLITKNKSSKSNKIIIILHHHHYYYLHRHIFIYSLYPNFIHHI